MSLNMWDMNLIFKIYIFMNNEPRRTEDLEENKLNVFPPYNSTLNLFYFLKTRNRGL